MLIAASFFVALSGIVGCSPSEETDDPEPDTGVEDDVDDDGDVDATDEPACDYQTDCADDEYCHDGDCHEARSCPSTQTWELCTDYFADIDESLKRRGYCDGEHCRLNCRLDEHCPGDDVCSDYGNCIPFTGELTGDHPGGDEQQPLEAGIGEAPLEIPIGISLAGFGEPGASGDGRYAEALDESHGAMHELGARALAVDDGERQLMMIRAPLVFPTGALHEAIARQLQEETGDDWRSSLLISGTHTHSGPGRFWHIPDPDDTQIPLGMFGIDEFHEQVFDWIVDSLTASAVAALDDLAPARMGWEVVEQFDEDDVISSDRRGQTPPFDDNRVLLIRVDDADGNPRAVFVSFGTHGTVNSGSYASDDVIVGAEQQLEFALGKHFDRRVPVMYFNQNGGTMSPRGSSSGHDHTQRFEALGSHLVDRTFETIETMETTDDLLLDGHTHRFPILHEYLDYGGGGFADDLYGGLMCPDNTDDDDYTDHTSPDDYGCGPLGFHHALGNRPLTPISKSQISAFELGDLTLVTMPGELSMPLGWQVQRELRDAYDIDPFDSFTLGYAQDHLLYLLPTNLRGEMPPFPGISLPQAPDEYPEYAISYLQGGYEADMSPWGHNFGDFLVDRAVEAVGLMRGDLDEPAHAAPKPEEYSRRDHGEFPIYTTDADDVGTITEGPADQVERREFVEVAWLGGDAGAEMPQTPRVTLERRDDDGDFEPMTLPDGRTYDNRSFSMLSRLRHDDQDRPEWVVYWDERHDFPLGTYRFRIDGHYLPDDDGEITGYEATTDSFDLTGSTAGIVDEVEATDESTISFRASHPGADALDVSEESDDPARPSGSYRMHHRRVPSGVGIPFDADEIDDIEVSVEHNGATLTVDDVEATTEDEERGGHSQVPVTRVDVELDEPLEAGATVEIDIEVVDIHQNSATETVSLEYDP